MKWNGKDEPRSEPLDGCLAARIRENSPEGRRGQQDTGHCIKVTLLGGDAGGGSILRSHECS